MESKTCRTCKSTLPASAFWADSRRKGGRFSECVECGRSRNAQWKSQNRASCSKREAARAPSRRMENPIRAMWKGAKDRARSKGIPFCITLNDISIPHRCPVSGEVLMINRGKATDSSPSLDRINNALGYIPGNVLVVSWRVNKIKRDASLEELKAIVAFYEALK